MLTVGSLFTGIGGFDLGLEQAGMSIEWQVEKDEWCRKRLGQLWPTVPCHYDIRTIDWRFIPRVDLVCGGFPCQPFSLAGQQRGAKDDRYLWPEVVRCLEAVRPTWFIGENVPGFASMAQFTDEPPVDAEGAALGKIGDVYHRMGRGIANEALATLEGLGYQVVAFAIPACAVDARHIRQRIWILGYSRRFDNHGRSCECRGQEAAGSCNRTARSSEHAEYVAYGYSERKLQSQGDEQEKRERSGDGSADAADSNCESLGWPPKSWSECCEWEPEPNMGRVAHGVPDRMDRLRALGNAIVPQIAEEFGRMILAVEESMFQPTNPVCRRGLK